VGSSGDRYPDWVRELDGKSGVYVIRDASSHDVLYIGSSSTRLYDTLTRHFQQWRRYKSFWKNQYNEGHDPGLTYERARVEVAVRLTSSADALEQETRMIRRLNPRDNIIGQPELEDAPF
jgi:excinuclease UvrABC nuclease subunit